MAGNPRFDRKSVLDYTPATSAFIWGFVKHGDYVYVAAHSDGIYVIDVSDPANPSYVTRLNIPQPNATGFHTGGTGDAVLFDASLTFETYWDASPSTAQWANGPSRTAYNIDKSTSGGITANTNTTVTATGVTWDDGDEYRLENTTAFYLPITDVIVIGNTLYACGRTVVQSDTTRPPVGIIASFDLTAPALPVHQDSYRPPSMNPIPVESGFYGNEWYQGMATDGTYLYLASQLNGLVVMDVSTPSNMLRHGQYGKAELEAAKLTTPALNDPSLYFEDSRITINNGWAYLANHGNGTFALDISSPATPANGQWYDAPIEGGVDLRTRHLASDTVNGKDYIFECNNTSGLGNEPERGLVVRNVTNPTSATPNSYFYAAIATADVDTWNGEGDKPDLGIAKHGNYCYIANGQRGTAVFDVTDPESPSYIGLQGASMEVGTNLFATYLFDSGGKTYAYYGDGKSSPQLSNIYADEVIPMAQHIYGSSLTPLTTNTQTFGPGSCMFNGGEEIRFTITEPETIVRSRTIVVANAGTFTMQMGLYNVNGTFVATSDPTIVVAPALNEEVFFTWSSYPIIAPGDYFLVHEYTAGTQFLSPRGLANATTTQQFDFDGPSGNFWNPETTGTTQIAVQLVTESILPTTAPTLTTPYSNQQNNTSDVVNIPSQFSGATSYSLIGAPAGVTIHPTTGLIAGTITSAESVMFTTRVLATNSLGSLLTGFSWGVGANAGKSINSINYDLWATATGQVGDGKAYNDLEQDYNEL